MVNRSFCDQLFKLDHQVAVVTGAGQNIGQGIALALGLSGARVAIIDLDIEKANHTQQLLAQHGVESIALVADVTNPQQVDTALTAVISQWGKLDIAFNNVGLCYGGNAEDFSLADWQQMMKVNLEATFYGCQQQFKLMREQASGKIINIASVAGVLVPHPQKMTAYNTAKAGIIHMTRSLAAEWISFGVRVNALSPGTIYMPSFEEGAVKEWLVHWQQQIPSKRLAQVQDLLGPAIFLASSASDYLVGQNIVVDGGHTLW